MNEDNLQNGRIPENMEEERQENEPVKKPLGEEEEMLLTEDVDVESLNETEPDGPGETDSQEEREAGEGKEEEDWGRADETTPPACDVPPKQERSRCSWWRPLALVVVVLIVLNVMWTQMNRKIASQLETTHALQALVEKMNGDYEASVKNLGEMKEAVAALTEEMAGFQESLGKVEGSSQRHEAYLRNDLNRQRAAADEISRLVAVQESLLGASPPEKARRCLLRLRLPPLPAFLRSSFASTWKPCASPRNPSR